MSEAVIRKDSGPRGTGAGAPGTSDQAPEINLQNIPFELSESIAARARIGLVVLASDHSIEHEWRRLLDLPGVALYQSRIENDPTINAATLKQMEARLTATTDLLLPGVPFDVIGYGCTSGATVIGPDRVAERIRAARPGVACSDPMSAALAAFRSFGAKRIALLTPYVEDVNLTLRAYIQSQGFTVPAMGSFNEDNDNNVSRISPESMHRAAFQLGRSDLVDGVFVSCTSLRVLDIITDLERALGKPVTSSNHALAWHCLRLAGIKDKRPEFGRLFTQQMVAS